MSDIEYQWNKNIADLWGADRKLIESLRSELAKWHSYFGTSDVVVATTEFDKAHEESQLLHRILTQIASHGIHTDRVDAQITMGLEDQQKDLIEVLTREIERTKPHYEPHRTPPIHPPPPSPET